MVFWLVPCSVKVPYLLPISSTPSPVSTPYLLLMFSQYIICTAHVQRKYDLPCPCLVISTPSLHHLYCPCPIRIPSFLPMLVHHLSCPNPVCTPSFLPMSNQNATCTVHVELILPLMPMHSQSVHHLYNPCSISIPSLQPKVPSLHHLYKPYSDSTQSLQLIPKQYPITTAHVQSLPHLHISLPPMSRSYTSLQLCPDMTTSLKSMSII